MTTFDFDFLVIGSGFGGSVSALRLAEKGYRVGVVEMGKRWSAETYPKTTWDARRFLWLPQLKLYGIFRMTLLRDVFVLSGTGVGGGSHTYAATLLAPPDEVWSDTLWARLADWKTALAPHYETARRYLGVATNPRLTAADRVLREYAEGLGTADTFRPTEVGLYFGEAGKTVPDPFFDGEGPDRTGCRFCGGCMVGCRHGAKNTLDRNYLYLAEKRGVQIVAETRATLVSPRDGGGYIIDVERSTAWLAKGRRKLTARGVVFAGGVLGTVPLLLACKERGALPALSDQLGNYVRTNSEAILGVTLSDDRMDMSEGIAITSEVQLDAHTHVEPVRYPKGSDALALLTTPLTDGGGSVPRALRWVGVCLRHPLQFLRTLWPFGWAPRTLILLVMQTTENYMRVHLRRRWWSPFQRGLDSEGSRGVPTYLPAANDAARALAKKLDAIATSSITEVLLDVPTTAHILGGCAMGRDASEGVIDAQARVFGYDDLYVVDGSMIGANLGVNPSLTITALAEHAMSHVPGKSETDWV